MSRKSGETHGNKQPKPEEVFTKLRQAAVRVGQGMLRLDSIQLKELKRFQKENERLHKAVSDLKLDERILAEAAKEGF